MEKELRRVQVKIQVLAPEAGQCTDSMKGYFHQWGTALYETADGQVVPYTVGIVELVNGVVVHTIPSYITFIYEDPTRGAI